MQIKPPRRRRANVGEGKRRHATPSFFCRLVDEVVYWNTMRSPGLTMRLAACAISATSWKPDRISFSLPGYAVDVADGEDARAPTSGTSRCRR